MLLFQIVPLLYLPMVPLLLFLFRIFLLVLMVLLILLILVLLLQIRVKCIFLCMILDLLIFLILKIPPSSWLRHSSSSSCYPYWVPFRSHSLGNYLTFSSYTLCYYLFLSSFYSSYRISYISFLYLIFTFENIMYPRALIQGNLPSATYTQLLRNQLSLTSLLTIAISSFVQAGRKT